MNQEDKQLELDELYSKLPSNVRDIVFKIVELELELEKDCNQ